MEDKVKAQQQSAKHLAARAVMAYRAGFPIELLSITTAIESQSGIVCDWRSQTAVQWGLTRSVTDTDPFAHGGYKLASRLLRSDPQLIDTLAKELSAKRT
jgi:hypothetical protein